LLWKLGDKCRIMLYELCFHERKSEIKNNETRSEIKQLSVSWTEFLSCRLSDLHRKVTLLREFDVTMIKICIVISSVVRHHTTLLYHLEMPIVLLRFTIFAIHLIASVLVNVFKTLSVNLISKSHKLYLCCKLFLVGMMQNMLEVG